MNKKIDPPPYDLKIGNFRQFDYRKVFDNIFVFYWV